MSLLGTFARKKKDAAVQEAPPCQHWELAPRWGSAADMGNAALVTHYQCCACGVTVPKEEARRGS